MATPGLMAEMYRQLRVPAGDADAADHRRVAEARELSVLKNPATTRTMVLGRVLLTPLAAGRQPLSAAGCRPQAVVQLSVAQLAARLG